MLSVLVLIAVSTSPQAGAPRFDATIGLDAASFISCVAATEAENQRAWAFMPTENGGTLTDAGVNGSHGSYALMVRRAADSTHVQLFADNRGERSAELLKAINRCR